MERQFYNEEFERFFKDNAKQYRMYPSEKAWKRINSAFHIRPRWYLISSLALLFITGTLISLFVINSFPENADVIAKDIYQPNLENKISLRRTVPAINVPSAISKASPEDDAAGFAQLPLTAQK